MVTKIAATFIESCLSNSKKPRIFFVWTTNRDSTGYRSIHEKTLVCINPSAVPLDPGRQKRRRRQ